jgi:hypothetical protein
METKNYLEDLNEIKSIMNRSTQFLSLSGLSGIFAGIYALIGAAIVKYVIVINRINYKDLFINTEVFFKLTIIASLVLIFSIITAYYFSLKKANFDNKKLWNATSYRMFLNFSIPFFTGVIFILLLLKNQYYDLVMPMTLIFYGMSCLQASKYTFRDIRFLGISEIVLGLIAVEFTGFGLLFWSLGFGVLHIIYGTIMYFKYDKIKNSK